MNIYTIYQQDLLIDLNYNKYPINNVVQQNDEGP